MRHIGIVIPTYNEAENIQALLNGISKHTKKIPATKFTVVVVDDDSSDGTIYLVKNLALKFNSSKFNIFPIHQNKKTSYGSASIRGMRYLIEKKVDFVITMDADLSHNPKYLPAFVNLSDDHTLVIGSRYIKGGGVPDWSWYRKRLSLNGNRYARLILDRRITDYTGGYNLYSASLLNKLDLKSITSSGYGFLIEIKHRALKNTTIVAELPIIFLDRTLGRSKMPKTTLFTNLLLVPKLRISSKRGKK